jgi:hypothetical protein
VCYGPSSLELDAKDNSASFNQLKYSTEDNYIHYCYILNNYASNYGCIGFAWYMHKCEESNFINNSQASSSNGILYCDCYPSATVRIYNCCLIKNSGGYLFSVNTGSTMEVRECTIQSGYSLYGAVTTSYSNTVAGSECAVISNCGARIINDIAIYSINIKKIICSDWDIVLLHKIHVIWTILKYIKLVCYNNIFIKYITIMCNIYEIYRIYCSIRQDKYNIPLL